MNNLAEWAIRKLATQRNSMLRFGSDQGVEMAVAYRRIISIVKLPNNSAWEFSGKLFANIFIICFIDPVGYLEMVYLFKNCELVMTDSGGLQKEAYFFEKYCVTMRDETEWVELVDNGFNRLTGSDKELIVTTCKQLMNTPKSGFESRLYGNGDAGMKIVESLLDFQ